MNNKIIKIKIVTQERVVFEDEILWVTLPSIDGEITILPNHIQYITMLRAGEMLLKKVDSSIWLFVSGGFIEFSNNNLTILADTAERAEDIDIERAKEARRRAEEIRQTRELEKDRENDLEFEKAVAAIKRATFRINVAKKHRTKHSTNINS